MKAIQTKLVITRITAKVDGSISFGASTPELTAEEKVEFMNLQNMSIDALLTPVDEPKAPQIKVAGDLNQKTPSQRLHAVLFILWDQSGRPGDFDDFYKKEMERIINVVKGNLE